MIIPLSGRRSLTAVLPTLLAGALMMLAPRAAVLAQAPATAAQPAKATAARVAKPAGGSSSSAYSAADTAGRPVPIVGAEDRDRLTFRRELFTYANNGRRDPFSSLMSTGELRPLVSDLRLVAIAWDSQGTSTVAILRDTQTNEQYRAKVGQLLGRLRVTAIGRKSITFTIEEFGFSRQETLSLGDSTNQRTQQ